MPRADTTDEMPTPMIGLVGLGVLGRGIAACLVGYGYRVVARELDAATVAATTPYMDRAMTELVERAGFPESVLQWRSRFHVAASLSEFADCEFVIESVSEDAALKATVLRQIEAVVGETTPISVNTSGLPISPLQAACRVPDRIVGMHWHDPAYVTRFLEIVRGDQTSDVTMAAAEALAVTIGKEPAIIQRDVPGAVANRLGYAMLREALHLIDEGVVEPEMLDRAFRHSIGWWSGAIGPLANMDRVGNPLYAKVMQDMLPHLSTTTELARSFQERLDRGESGMAAGQGFRAYGPEDKALWDARLAEFAWAIRAFTDTHIEDPDA